MKTRKFLVYCIIYTAVVAGLTYSLNSSDFTFELLGQAITLPVAVWVALPVALLALLALLHIAYHGYAFYRYKKWIKKDSQLYKDLAKELVGPKALAIAYEGEIIAAKALSNFSKQNDKIKIAAGVVAGQVVGKEMIAKLANIPPREQLLTMLACGLIAPVRNVTIGLNMLKEKADKMSKGDWQKWHKLKREAQKLIEGIDKLKSEPVKNRRKLKVITLLNQANEIYPLNYEEWMFGFWE